MGTADGTIIGATKIVDNGPDSKRFNMVIVAEGYQSTQMTQFANDAAGLLTSLRATPPFDTLLSAMNVHRLDVTSTDSGADDPTSCADGSSGTGATPRTYFDATYCSGGIRRLLVVNSTRVVQAVSGHVPAWHTILVVVNATLWGGSGGSVGTYSLAPGANRIAIHEMGHTAFGLADEYPYWAGCGIDTNRNNHPAAEPSEPNVTINSNRDTIKWRHHIASTTAMPTMSNPDCTQCDNRASTVAAGTVGAFEGAHYYHCGAFRPEHDCYMRNAGQPFCAVCRGAITAVLQPFMPVGQTGALHQFAWVSGSSNYRYGHRSAPYVGITGGPATADLSRFAMLHDGSNYRLYCWKSGTTNTLHQFSFNGSAYAYGHQSSPEITLTGFPSDVDTSNFSMTHDGSHYRVFLPRSGHPQTLYQGTHASGTTNYRYDSSPTSISITGFPADTDFTRWDTVHDGTYLRYYAFKQGSNTQLYQGTLNSSSGAIEYGRQSSDMTLLAGPANSRHNRSAMLHDGSDYRFYFQTL